MNPGLKIINEIPAIQLSAQATSLQALIRRLKDTNLTDIDHTTGIQHFHSSMTIFSKEFTVFLGYHNNELISALCDWYDCDRKWVYETIARKSEEIIGVWVNMIAGTTPDLIRSSLPIQSIGAGLTSRIIFVFEEKAEKLVTIPTETAAERELFEYLVRDLESISLESGSYRWTEGFMRLWDDWCREAQVNPPFRDSKFDGYNGRRIVHLMKLSMICSMSHGKNGLVLTEGDLKRAIGLLTEVELKMGNTFRGLGKSDISELIHRALGFLLNSPERKMPIFKFARHFEDDMDDQVLDRVIKTMEISKIVKRMNVPGGDDYLVTLVDRHPDN